MSANSIENGRAKYPEVDLKVRKHLFDKDLQGAA